MRKRMIWMAFVAIAAVTLTTGCQKQVEDEAPVSNEPGTEIFFGAFTDWENEPGTRTEYSGKDQNNNDMNKSTSEYERIDWVNGKDVIRILCDAAEPRVSGGGHQADYVVNNVKMDPSDKKKSQATIVSVDENSLHWGTQTHYFYALYPAPGMESNYNFTDKTVQAANSKIESVAENKAKVTGMVPGEQNAVKVENIYKPNMNYAYMYATTQATPGQSGRVLLSFNPLVTTLEFSLMQIASDPVSANLTRLELSSSSTPLTGTFEATIDGTGSTPNVGISAPSWSEGTNDKVTITLPSPGVQLSDTPVKFTFLTLPVDQTDLLLTLYFGNDYAIKRTLKLNTTSGPVTVPACKKAYFNFGVPGTIPYVLEVQGPESSIAAGGGNGIYKVKSYKRAGSEQEVGWTIQFSTDNGSTWGAPQPDWLTAFTTSDPVGSLEFKSYTATASANNSLVDKTWQGGISPAGHETRETARNLSHYDIYGNRLPSSSGYADATSTANCYVVSEPGWYKIPAVYGNSYKNGVLNPDAYGFGGTGSYPMPEGGIRHDGNKITNPWISENGFDINGRGSAKLLWQDAPNLVQNVSLETNFIYFEVPAATIQQGNALLAVDYIDGVIVWSWHIWVIEKEKLGTTTVYSHVDNPSVENPVDMMNVNLGWYDAEKMCVPRSVRVKVTQNESGNTAEFIVSQTAENSFGGNVHYQWGRKDPMLGFNEHYQEKQQYYTNDNLKFKLGPPGRVGDGAFYQYGDTRIPAFQESIQHPNIFYRGYYWTRTRYDNLWNRNAQFKQDTKVVKTIYDPCPVGFKVPNMKVYTGFGVGANSQIEQEVPNAIGPFLHGHLFRAYPGDTKGIFFPSMSLREFDDGSIRTYAGEMGEYYTAAMGVHNSTNVQGTPYYFEFYYDNARPLWHDGVISYGFSVRPIADK